MSSAGGSKLESCGTSRRGFLRGLLGIPVAWFLPAALIGPAVAEPLRKAGLGHYVEIPPFKAEPVPPGVTMDDLFEHARESIKVDYQIWTWDRIDRDVTWERVR